MQPSKSRGGMLARLSSVVSRLQREPEFTCSDCERWERCGSPPDDACVVRAAQLERGDWKLRRRARALSRTVGQM
jgi:hypothetical protein